jgi:hypothetical protein
MKLSTALLVGSFVLSPAVLVAMGCKDCISSDTPGGKSQDGGPDGGREPRPQSPYYRGKDLKDIHYVLGIVNDGRVDESRGTTLDAEPDSSGQVPTVTFQYSKINDPCMNTLDSSNNVVPLKDDTGTPFTVPLYTIRVTTVAGTFDPCATENYQGDVNEDSRFCGGKLNDIQGKAIAIPGWWDDKGQYHQEDGKFTFSCISGVTAKCVHWGYLPWIKNYRQGQSLLPYYQACVPAARADYFANGGQATCGDTIIDIFDKLGIRQRDRAADEDAGANFEASWGSSGAAKCIRRSRYEDPSSNASCPPVADAGCGNATYECGDWDATGALVCVWSKAHLTRTVNGSACPQVDEHCKLR